MPEGMPKTGTIELPEIRQVEIIVPIVGKTPYIAGAWSEKAREEMRQKQMGPKIRKAREAKDPVAEADGRTYWLKDGQPGIPAVAFKGAMVRAVLMFGGKEVGLPMTEARTMFYVYGEGDDQLVPIEGEWTIREDMVRIASGADLRYRNMFWPWSTSLRIGYIESRIDRQSIIRLVQAAGIGGVGEWRTQKTNGNYGQFAIDTTKPIQVV